MPAHHMLRTPRACGDGEAPRPDRALPDGAGIPAIEALILAYQPLVRALAVRLLQALPATRSLERDDLEQAGFVGLVSAARIYDHSLGVAFSVFAQHRIRGEMLDTLRRMDLASRQLRRLQKLYDSARNALAAKLHREPTEEEIQEMVKAEAPDIRDHDAALATIALLSRIPQDPQHLPGRVDTQPDSICAQNELRRALDGAFFRLSDRHRQVIALYYDNGMTMKQIGSTLRVNESRVSQLRKGALDAMARSLRAGGIRRSSDFLRCGE